MAKDLIFSSSSELIRLPAQAVVYIVANGNYSTITMADRSKYILTMQLGKLEQRIAERLDVGDKSLIRIGKSLIINRGFITFINPARQKLILSDCRTFRHEVSASREALKALKEYIEQEDSK